MLKSCFRVAVTGSLFSGKSEVCRLFQQWGAYVTSADHIIHQAYLISSVLNCQVAALIGSSGVSSKVIDRRLLAEYVRLKPYILDRIEDLTHPYVNKTIRKIYRSARWRSYKLFVAEMPLLFESRYPIWQWFNKVIVVVTDREAAQKHYIENGGSKEQFQFLASRQMSDNEKVQKAHYVVGNTGDLSDLEREARAIFDDVTCKRF